MADLQETIRQKAIEIQEFFEHNKRIIVPIGIAVGGLALYSIIRRRPGVPPPGGELPPSPSAFTVVIDPGHGGNDPGAVHVNDIEKQWTLKIANLVATFLTRRGIKVVQTRTSDINVSLEERVKITANANANAFVSIHLDSVPEQTYYKWCSQNHVVGLYSELNPKGNEGMRLATSIASKVASARGVNYSIRDQRIYVLDHSPCPAALIEIGFICNYWFMWKLFWSYAYRELIAKAIADGIIEFLGTPY